MKLGIVADEIDRNFAKAVLIGTELGIRRYEIRNLPSGRAPMCAAGDLEEVERIADGEGVEITALSPGLFKYTEDEPGFAREMSDVYPRAVEWARRWRLPGLITFGFRKPGATEENAVGLPRAAAPEHIVDWLTRAGVQETADGMLLLIEPEPVCWADTATVTADLIERSGSQGLRMNYDPGNVAWLEQRDPIGEFDRAAQWIANVHVKDLLPLKPGASRPEFVPAGEGMIDFRAHFEKLWQAGYRGPVSLEPHMDGSMETIRRCKDAFERLSGRYGAGETE
jgi:sugar phosphate isomerase/epimerase